MFILECATLYTYILFCINRFCTFIGNRAVLGLPGPSGPHVLPNGIPIEHAVSTQTLRPGSGFLNVTVITDGPTRVIKIVDVKQVRLTT